MADGGWTVGAIRYLLVLAIAVIISGQILMVIERGKSLTVRLRDLGLGGDGITLLGVALLIAGAAGALLGDLLGSASFGAGSGALLAACTWTAAVVLAHRQPEPPAQHRGPSTD